eukprot:TRINITY_DN47_c0_g1_i6.p1 TRINITY_DN47_c0_g1~~TRINITY_DN47_c0_g1_i6.p1  ORF type:complete len:1302 (+),score=219.93 TRINITY_DN47_c0_g1_i6:539-3907(+)
MACLRTIQEYNWNKFVLGYTTDRYGTTNGEQISKLASNYGFPADAIAVFTMPPSFFLLPADSLADIEVQIVRKIRLSQIRVVVQISLLEDSQACFRIAQKNSLIGPGWAWLGGDAWANFASQAKLVELDDGSLGFSRQDLLGSVLVIASEEETAMTQRFRNRYMEKYGTAEMEPFILAGYDCVRALGLAVLDLLARNQSLSAAMLPNMALNSGIQGQLADRAMGLEFEGAGGFVQFAKPGSLNAGDRVPKYTVSIWTESAGGSTWLPRASFDLNRHPDFLSLGTVTFSNGLSNLSADAPGCPAGSELSASGDSCQPCAEGHYKAAGGREACALCQAGFACLAGSVAMSPCPAGTSSGAASSNCADCPPGRANPSLAAESCQACSPGFFQEASGQEACNACSFGAFQESWGETTCHLCPASFTTLLPGSSSPESCGCGQGFRIVREPGLAPHCVGCERGLKCPAFNATPLVDAGYYKPDRAPLTEMRVNIFKCSDQIQNACPGQKTPEESVCADHRMGINCGLCAEGFYSSEADCVPCQDAESAFIGAPVLLLVPALGLLHYAWNHGKSAHVEAVEGALGSLTVGTTLAFIQSLGILNIMRLPWPSELVVLLSFFEIFLFDVSILRPECFMQKTLLSEYAVRLAGPLVTAGSLALWWPLSRGLNRISRIPRFRSVELFNTAGMLYMSFSISVSVSTVSILDCYESPNEKHTIRSMSYVVCGGDEYMLALPLLALGILVYIAGAWSAIIFAIARAPKLYAYSDSFRASVRFLVYKFRACRWWFNLILLARSLGLALVTVIFPNGMFEQWLMTTCTMLLALMMHVQYQPYSEGYANMVETAEIMTLVGIMLLGAAFIDAPGLSGEAPNSLGVAMIVLFALCSVVVMAALAWAMTLAFCSSIATKAQERDVQQIVPKLLDAFRLAEKAGKEGALTLLKVTDFADHAQLIQVAELILRVHRDEHPGSFFRQRLWSHEMVVRAGEMDNEPREDQEADQWHRDEHPGSFFRQRLWSHEMVVRAGEMDNEPREDQEADQWHRDEHPGSFFRQRLWSHEMVVRAGEMDNEPRERQEADQCAGEMDNEPSKHQEADQCNGEMDNELGEHQEAYQAFLKADPELEAEVIELSF